MPTILKELRPVAKKEHKCMFCGCTIKAGERYRRATLMYDGDLYDWVSHEDCQVITDKLNMYDYADYDGISAEDFTDIIDEYLYNNYQDKELDDLPEHIYKMTRIEQVRMILDDINSKSK